MSEFHKFTLYVRTEKCKRCGHAMTHDWLPSGKHEALGLKRGHGWSVVHDYCQECGEIVGARNARTSIRRKLSGFPVEKFEADASGLQAVVLRAGNRLIRIRGEHHGDKLVVEDIHGRQRDEVG